MKAAALGGRGLAGVLVASAMAVVHAGTGQAELLLRGYYEGKNLLVRNPSVPGMTGSCITQLAVNGSPVAWREEGVISVELQAFKLQLSDPVTVRITHQAACVPKVLNPEALRRHSPGGPPAR